MDYEPTEYDRTLMKIDITMTFAEFFDRTCSDAASLFKANGIYEYLDRGADIFISETYPYMANHVAQMLGLPFHE